MTTTPSPLERLDSVSDFIGDIPRMSACPVNHWPHGPNCKPEPIRDYLEWVLMAEGPARDELVRLLDYIGC